MTGRPEARARRGDGDGFSVRGDDALSLVRAVAHGLPEALDDESAAKLAARIRPFFQGSAADDDRRSNECLLTVAEAASRAHVHAETVRRAIRDGRLPIAGRVGRSARINAVDLDRWLADASGLDGTMRPPMVRRTRSQPTDVDEHSLKAAFKNAASEL